MSNLFSKKNKEEFLEGVDRGLGQAKRGERQDAHEAMDELTRELEAGYDTIMAVQAAHHSRKAAVS